jgi:hypothetical protein
MILYVLKHNKNLKIKNLLFVIKNYNLFNTNFEFILNSPQYSLLVFSMKQNELRYLKHFLFFKLKTINFCFKKSSFLRSKQNTQEKFLNRIFSILLVHLFFYITKAIFSYFFSFIPQKFRSQNFQTQFDKFLKNIKIAKPLVFTLNCSLAFNKLTLLQNFIKFLKKLINDNFFIKFAIFIFLIQLNFFSINELKLKMTISFTIFEQIEYLISFLLTKFVIDLYKNISIRFKKIFYYVKLCLQQSFKNNAFKKQNYNLFNTLKNKKNFVKVSFIYFKSLTSYFIAFFGNFSFFKYIIKKFSIFSKNFFPLDLNINNFNSFRFLGLQYKIVKRLKTIVNKDYFVSLKTKSLKLSLLQYLPANKINVDLFNLGILNVQFKPSFFTKLLPVLNKNIFDWYFSFFNTFYNYYKKCKNFHKFCLILVYILKWSLFLTLGKKHKKSLKYVFLKYIRYFKVKFQSNFKDGYFIKIISRNLKFLTYAYKYYL